MYSKYTKTLRAIGCKVVYRVAAELHGYWCGQQRQWHTPPSYRQQKMNSLVLCTCICHYSHFPLEQGARLLARSANVLDERVRCGRILAFACVRQWASAKTNCQVICNCFGSVAMRQCDAPAERVTCVLCNVRCRNDVLLPIVNQLSHLRKCPVRTVHTTQAHVCETRVLGTRSSVHSFNHQGVPVRLGLALFTAVSIPTGYRFTSAVRDVRPPYGLNTHVQCRTPDNAVALHSCTDTC